MTVRLPCFGIVLQLDGDGGTINSDLHTTDDTVEQTAALDAVESLILAHAVAGVDIASPAYIEGIEVAVESIFSHI